MKTLSLILLPLLVVSTVTLPHASLADPLYTLCSDSSGNYTSNDQFSKNLDDLVKYYLPYGVPPTGFGRGGILLEGIQTWILGLCRGDITSDACRTCVSDAASQLRRDCPNQKEAITWYDNCMVRYAERRFLDILEDGFRVYLVNSVEVSQPAVFNEKVVNLLKRVSSEAYGNEKKLFGTEEADVVVEGKKEKLYSLAQCTRDITAADCKRCLQHIVADFPNCCNARRGGRVLTASCNFRYELYPFY